jgi:hypothetical protein
MEAGPKRHEQGSMWAKKKARRLSFVVAGVWLYFSAYPILFTLGHGAMRFGDMMSDIFSLVSPSVEWLIVVEHIVFSIALGVLLGGSVDRGFRRQRPVVACLPLCGFLTVWMLGLIAVENKSAFIETSKFAIVSVVGTACWLRFVWTRMYRRLLS